MKKYIGIFLMIGMLLVLGGCTNNQKEVKNQETGKNQSLTIGLMPDVDSIPFIIAQEKGYFKEEGLNVKLESFKSAVDRDSALQSGKLDGAVSDMLAETFGKEGGFDVVITSLSSGSYKLILGKDETATRLEDLKDKDVAISKNTIIEYVTDKIMIKNGLGTEHIHKTIIPQIPTRLEMLKNGKIAAATLPEPLATIAVKNGGKVLSGSDQLGINPGVILFTTKTVSTKEQELKAMYRAYNKAIDYLEKEPMEKYIEVLIEKGGFPESVRGSLVLPAYQKASAPKQQDMMDVLAWLKERGLIQKNYSYEELVDNRFVR